jgi:hypothetical protein
MLARGSIGLAHIYKNGSAPLVPHGSDGCYVLQVLQQPSLTFC